MANQNSEPALSTLEHPKESLWRRLSGVFIPRIPADTSRKELNSKIFKIAIPSIMELLLVQLASMVSTVMVSNLGSWATASVGYCTQPRFVLLAVFVALNSGTTAVVARMKGANDAEGANRAMHQSLMISLSISGLLALVGYVFATDMVVFMGAETEQTITAATQYMQMQMLAFPFTAVTLGATAILRGVGQTKVSMVYNIIANVVNVICNLFIVYGAFGFPRLEVLGAGISLGIGQVIAFFVAARALIKGPDILKLDIKKIFHIDKDILGKITKIGTPAMAEQLIMRGGMMIFTLTISSLGTEDFATHTIANNILALSFTNGQAMGIAATSLLGQSMGSKRVDIGKASVGLCTMYSIIVSFVIAGVLLFFGDNLMGIYTDEILVIQKGAQLLMVVAIIQPLQSIQMVVAGALRGAGDTKAVAVCTFIGILLMRPIISYTTINFLHWGLVGAWVGMLTDQSVRSIYTTFRFTSDKWTKIKI